MLGAIDPRQGGKMFGLKRRAQARPPAGDYTGTLSQRFEQALGTPTRYVSPNAGNQRLNSMYDNSLGFGMSRR